MVQRIGILTHYYKSINYGGNLQAFALTYALNKMRFKAEQIAIKLDFTRFEKEYQPPMLRYGFLKRVKNKFIALFLKMVARLYINKKLTVRSSKIIMFNNSIPHSNEYTLNNVETCINDYDCFISGSDQVWNLDWFFPPFFLSFVPPKKTKISYAASLGHSFLPKEREDFFRHALSNFDYISVREIEAVNVLQPLTHKKIDLVLDPTYLLSEKEWSSFCRSRTIFKKYILCYFLGPDKRIRKVAKKYAKKNKLVIVNLPHLMGINESDLLFGNYKLFDIDPFDFITLIKYSECVFTDSFHACVFSTIFKKNFYSFNRKGKENMSGRIKSLCDIFSCDNHFIEKDADFSMKSLERIKPINYHIEQDVFNNLKQQSISFLNKALLSR